MITRRRIPYIFFVIVAISLGIGNVFGAIYESVFAESVYNIYYENKREAAGNIGLNANSVDVPLLKSIEEITNIDTEFSIRLENESGFSYTLGNGFFKDLVLTKIQLPSGEFVAAVINHREVIYNGGDISDDDITLPVGKVVYDEISDAALNQLNSSGEPLDRTDFYIDMVGGTIYHKDYLTQMISSIVTLVFAAIAFLIIRHIGIAIGFYPAVILSKKQKAEVQEVMKSDWE